MKHQKLETAAWHIMLKLQNTRMGILLIEGIYRTGLVDWYDKVVYRRDEMHPSEEMREEAQYYQKEKNRIQINAEKLEDEKSKETYKKTLRYRCTHADRDRPSYNRFDQYFPEDIVDLSAYGKVFVDCGAYNGDTAASFFAKMKKKGIQKENRKYIAFEPDSRNAQMIAKRFPLVTIKKAAVYKEEGEVSFSGDNGSVSRMQQDGAQSVRACTIDGTAECGDMTFLKMDIEGGELDALLGAKNTIMSARPLLAICIYHSKEDMIRLQEMIDSWSLGYKFYIRHHAPKISETVLYCIPAR